MPSFCIALSTRPKRPRAGWQVTFQFRVGLFSLDHRSMNQAWAYCVHSDAETSIFECCCLG